MANFSANPNAYFGVSVNNGGLLPLQGSDVDVFILDQATGKQALNGTFTSYQITIRRATEPYMGLNQSVPSMLDGEFQFGWVLERGMIDTRVVEQTFGFNAITREMKVGRSPRFTIVFDFNAPELDESAGGALASGLSGYSKEIKVGSTQQFSRRQAKGQLRFVNCKVDSFNMGGMAGRSVIANRWEGLAEGYYQSDNSNVWAGTILNSAATQFPSGLASVGPTNLSVTQPTFTFEGLITGGAGGI